MEFVKTADGSKTLYHDQVGEHYHSKHGAQQESIHVFLNTGLRYWLDKESAQSASILEIGFGTGLNFSVSLCYSVTLCDVFSYPKNQQYPEKGGDSIWKRYWRPCRRTVFRW